MNYAEAEALATSAHNGQTDRSGAPYIGHPIAVAAIAAELAPRYGVDPEDARVVGVLHDTVEDTELTAGHLRAAGLEPHRVAAVVALSRPREGCTYADFIGIVIAAGILEMVVKLGDLTHNTLPERSADSPDGQKRRYAKAKARLLEALAPFEVAARPA